MRDRLRAVECPSDIVDQVGGWQTEGVGHGYGKGYPLEVLSKWLEATAGYCQVDCECLRSDLVVRSGFHFCGVLVPERECIGASMTV
jgi:hypothetical protein